VHSLVRRAGAALPAGDHRARTVLGGAGGERICIIHETEV